MNRVRRLLSGLAWVLAIFFCITRLFSPWETNSVLLITTLAILVSVTIAASAPNNFPVYSSNFIPRGLGVLIFIAATILYLRDIGVASIWPSEALIIGDSIAILAGSFPDPFGSSGDFPSNYGPYLSAVPIAIVPDLRVAVRLIGVIATLSFSAMVAILCSRITGKKGALPLLFPLFSLWMLNLSITSDNNWIVLVPALGAATYLTYDSIARNPESSLIPFFALLLALSFWTLYVPIASSLAVLTLFLFDKRINRSSRWSLFVWLCPLLLPLFVSVFLSSEVLIGRQLQFITQTGEGELNTHLLDGYARTFLELARLAVPDAAQALHINRTLYLEHSSIVLILLGIIPLIRKQWSRLLPLQVFFILSVSTAAVLASNPLASFWRTVILAFPLYVYAGLGAIWIVNLSSSRTWQILANSIIILAHFLCFNWGHRLYKQQLVSSYWMQNEQLFTRLYEQCSARMITAEKIQVPDESLGYILTTLSRNRIKTCGAQKGSEAENPCSFTQVILGTNVKCPQDATLLCQAFNDERVPVATLCAPPPPRRI
jgi:hypothetical protein